MCVDWPSAIQPPVMIGSYLPSLLASLIAPHDAPTALAVGSRFTIASIAKASCTRGG
jgi:hypothetical protein